MISDDDFKAFDLSQKLNKINEEFMTDQKKPREWWISNKFGGDSIMLIEPALPERWIHVIEYFSYKYEVEKRNEAVELCSRMEKERDEERAKLNEWQEEVKHANHVAVGAKYKQQGLEEQLIIEHAKSAKLVEALRLVKYAVGNSKPLELCLKACIQALAEYEIDPGKTYDATDFPIESDICPKCKNRKEPLGANPMEFYCQCCNIELETRELDNGKKDK